MRWPQVLNIMAEHDPNIPCKDWEDKINAWPDELLDNVTQHIKRIENEKRGL